MLVRVYVRARGSKKRGNRRQAGSIFFASEQTNSQVGTVDGPRWSAWHALFCPLVIPNNTVHKHDDLFIDKHYTPWLLLEPGYSSRLGYGHCMDTYIPVHTYTVPIIPVHMYITCLCAAPRLTCIGLIGLCAQVSARCKYYCTGCGTDFREA